MLRFPIALVVLLTCVLVAPATSAHGASTVLCTGFSNCAGKGYDDGNYEANRSKSYWNMSTGTNCTNYVAYRLITTNGMDNKRPASGVGNARDWGKVMASITDSVATVGSVAWWGKTGNHVAYVEKVVSSSEIWVSESNWSGPFNWRKITKSGGGWPDGFIHFADPGIVNESKPAITSAATVGAPAKASAGVWSPKGNTYTYQWFAGSQKIPGATSRSFTPEASHVGKDLKFRVTATRGNLPAISATSAKATVEPGPFKGTATAAIIGTPAVDAPLSASSSTLTPAPTKQTFQWTVGGKTVSNEPTFTPRPEHVGQTVKVRIRSARTGYITTDVTSALSSPVSLATQVLTRRSAISGSLTVGHTLHATPGLWAATPDRVAYQWRVDGVDVPGATRNTYQLQPGDHGKSVSVVVTAYRAGYTTVSSQSAKTAAVAPGTLVNRAPGPITGVLRVGRTLRAQPGTWSPSAQLTYQWYADSAAIAGATAPTFTVTRHQLGARIRVRVTARHQGYSTASVWSPRTDAIARGAITVSTKPKITGDLIAGSRLRLSTGSTTPSAKVKAVQWYRDGSRISGATSTSLLLRSSDVGSSFNARVTYQAGGYDNLTAATSSTAKVKAKARLAVSTTTPGAGRVTFTVRVSAKGAQPSGNVTISGGATTARTKRLADGRVRITMTGLKAGRHEFTVRYAGSSRVASAEVVKRVSVSR